MIDKQCVVCAKSLNCSCYIAEVDTEQGVFKLPFCSIECCKKKEHELQMDLLDGKFHHLNCEIQGECERIWVIRLQSERDVYRRLYFETHDRWRRLKYPDDYKEKKTEVFEAEALRTPPNPEGSGTAKNELCECGHMSFGHDGDECFGLVATSPHDEVQCACKKFSPRSSRTETPSVSSIRAGDLL